MARHRIPQVIDDKLILLEADGSLPSILVGSAGWYAWLNDAATRSFAYRSAGGTLTARRERQHGHWYWYAYRSQCPSHQSAHDETLCAARSFEYGIAATPDGSAQHRGEESAHAHCCPIRMGQDNSTERLAR